MLHAIFPHGWEARDYLVARCENADAGGSRGLPAGARRRADRSTGVGNRGGGPPLRHHAARLPRLRTRCHAARGGTENVIAYSNLALATGHVGIEGAGMNPLRGQNNVQGACDMGALPDVLSGYQPVRDPSARAKFASAWGEELHDRPGLTTLGVQRAAHEGRCARWSSAARTGRHRPRTARGAAGAAAATRLMMTMSNRTRR